MADLPSDFAAHLASGDTTLCRAWAIIRPDGETLGFTDHDCGLSFDGIAFKAETGMSAMALQQSTGLSIDNTDAIGALCDDAIREEDIEAGRFDGAIGEIRRSDTAFEAELRGQTEALNRPMGRVFQKPCTAVLGDAACGVDLDTPGLHEIRAAEIVEDGRVFRWAGFDTPVEGWFARGRLSVSSGAAKGLSGLIKEDRLEGSDRIVKLWEPLRAGIAPGDMIRLDAGCDKRFATCEAKFANVVNFRGFPDMPGDDWMVATPHAGPGNTGGSRRG